MPTPSSRADASPEHRNASISNAGLRRTGRTRARSANTPIAA
jgi:hypothetical protein